MVGLVSTRMRYVELRDPDLKATDQPEFTPTSVLYAPEDNGRTTQLSSSNSSTPVKNDVTLIPTMTKLRRRSFKPTESQTTTARGSIGRIEN